MTLQRLKALVMLPGILILSIVGDLSAQDKVGFQVAVLDVNRILLSANAVKDIRSQLQSYMESYRSETLAEQQAIRISQEELARKRAQLSAEAYGEERRTLEQRLVQAQTRVQQRRRSLEDVNTQAMQEVQNALIEVVTELAKERNLSLIIRKDQTAYSIPALEVTDEVLQRLDSRLPTVRVAKPEE